MERSFYRFPDGCAVTEYGRLVEYLDLREESQYGDIVLAKADRMMRGMECAFVNIGRKKDGFLPLKENSRSFTDGEIHSGDLIAVQIKREETGDKGAFLTRDLTIPGKMIILMPKNRYIGVSGRIQDEKTRERLRETGKRIAGGEWGMVMRAASERLLKKCKNISVGISPTLSLLNSAFHTNQGLPPKSSTTLHRQSSIGSEKPYLSIPLLSPNACRRQSPSAMAVSSIV